jgi:hypothetical protein
MEIISTETGIAILSALLSTIELWQTYSVNKSFAKNQLITDHVKIATQLVNYLNSKKIELKFTSVSEDGNSRSSNSGEITIFEQ